MSPPTSWGATWGALEDHEASPHSPTTAIYGVTYGTYGGGHDSFLMGGRPPVAPLPPQFEVLSTAASSQARTPVPLAQPDLSLGSSSLVILVLKDSSATPTMVKGTTALVIKDKPSDLGLKDITNKDSWIKASKINNAHLRRSPYCPSNLSRPPRIRRPAHGGRKQSTTMSSFPFPTYLSKTLSSIKKGSN